MAKPKRQHERAVKVNLTIAPRLFGDFEQIKQKYRIDGPSEYFQLCLRRDLDLILPPLAESISR